MSRFGLPRVHHRRTDSTNTRARELAQDGAPAGTVVTADEQTAGRGRQGRRWSAPAGTALLYSAILRPLDLERDGLLPLAAAIAVAEAAESLAPVACAIKWPNDIWIEGRKAAGILIESHPAEPSWAVIGIGLNVAIAEEDFPADLRYPATSVGHGATVAAALDAVNERLGAWVAAEPESIVETFAERDALRGLGVAWEGDSGVAVGIDAAGHLLVDVGGETVALGAGEVHLTVG